MIPPQQSIATHYLVPTRTLVVFNSTAVRTVVLLYTLVPDILLLHEYCARKRGFIGQRLQRRSGCSPGMGTACCMICCIRTRIKAKISRKTAVPKHDPTVVTEGAQRQQHLPAA